MRPNIASSFYQGMKERELSVTTPFDVIDICCGEKKPF